MPRPQRSRRICQQPAYTGFSPDGKSDPDEIILLTDEFEVIRLVDLEKKTHEQCASQMDISRSTVTEIYESAREKIANSLINGRRLVIAGGNYRICDGSACGCGRTCRLLQRESAQSPENAKGEQTMTIAVTYENGTVFQHFGHTAQFKLYSIENGRIATEEVVDTNGSGHGALAGFLADRQVDALICGGIGGGAQTALAQAGIRLYGGVSGSADDAVKALLAGTLGYDPNARCDHHDHEHGDEGHACGSHGCGGHTCHE